MERRGRGRGEGRIGGRGRGKLGGDVGVGERRGRGDKNPCTQFASRAWYFVCTNRVRIKAVIGSADRTYSVDAFPYVSVDFSEF